jgi:hypothetical protein
MGKVYYGNEIEAISRLAGIPLGKLVAMQLIYEASTCCTSIVVPGANGAKHIRTMDWEMPFLMNVNRLLVRDVDFFKLTVELEFQRDNATIAYATSWAGYVGIMTGVRLGGFSVSLNFR